MRADQRGGKPQRRRKPPGRRVVLDAGDDQIAHLVKPPGVRKNHDREQEQRDPRLRLGKRRAAAPAQRREQRHQHEQDDAEVIRQQQQAEIDRQQEPVAAFVLAERAPIVQQRERPERRRHDAGAEFGARHGEDGDAGHQQHGQHRVAGADDGAAEREHRPIGEHDAGLRQRDRSRRRRRAGKRSRRPRRRAAARDSCRAGIHDRWPGISAPRPAARYRKASASASTTRLASAPRSRTRPPGGRAGIRRSGKRNASAPRGSYPHCGEE